METQPLIVERTYNAPIKKVWKAISDRDQMKEWYFDLSEFKPEKGFKFSFTGGNEKVQYVHNCEIIEVDPPHKLSYTWTYEGRAGYSVVTFELFKETEKRTRVKLTHEGIDSFSKGDPNFELASFTAGWNSILGESLKNYVETEIIRKSVSIAASPELVWNIILNPDNTWGKAFGGGAFVKSDWRPGSEVAWTDTDGNLGAKGVVAEHQENKYLQVDMYDDVNAPLGTGVGEYSEKYRLENPAEGETLLTIEAGPLAKKYIDEHGRMWDEAIGIIKGMSESPK